MYDFIFVFFDIIHGSLDSNDTTMLSLLFSVTLWGQFPIEWWLGCLTHRKSVTLPKKKSKWNRHKKTVISMNE